MKGQLVTRVTMNSNVAKIGLLPLNRGLTDRATEIQPLPP